MALTLADQYYLKALEDYDYSFEEVVENLNYALSYDTEHAGANFLMGKLYMEHFQQFELAEEYFIASMATDPENIATCEDYCLLLIRTRKFKEGLKLIKYALNLKGVIIPTFIRLEALIYELQKDFARSKQCLTRAIYESYDSSYISFLKSEMERVDDKAKSVSKLNYEII